jgi:hypothetical protein
MEGVLYGDVVLLVPAEEWVDVFIEVLIVVRMFLTLAVDFTVFTTADADAEWIDEVWIVVLSVAVDIDKEFVEVLTEVLILVRVFVKLTVDFNEFVTVCIEFGGFENVEVDVLLTAVGEDEELLLEVLIVVNVLVMLAVDFTVAVTVEYLAELKGIECELDDVLLAPTVDEGGLELLIDVFTEMKVFVTLTADFSVFVTVDFDAGLVCIE